MGLIINRAPQGKLNAGTADEVEKQRLVLLGIVPQDDMAYQYDCDGTPAVNLLEDSPVQKALDGIVKKLNL